LNSRTAHVPPRLPAFQPRLPAQVRFFVLDEADRLTEHADVIRRLWGALPKGGQGAARLQVRGLKGGCGG
jgi:hypothetical protein